MTVPFRQNLPDLAAYRAEFVAGGLALPLPAAPWQPGGLLASLPRSPAGRRGWPWDVETKPFASSLEGWPLITIVTPSFQQDAYLEETLRSVLLQNYPNLEFIVLDGGSTDASPAMIARYRPWLSFARVARDRGQSHAINLGFSIGGGKIYGWINSDDFFMPGVFRHIAEEWRRGAEFIYGDRIILDQESGKVSHEVTLLAHARYVKFAGLVMQPGSFWSAARHLPLWEEQQCALDYELWIRLLPGLRLRHLCHPLAVAREHGAAKTFNPAMQHRWEEDAKRNDLAHPHLYRGGFASRLLHREFRLVQSLWKAWRACGLAARLEAVRRKCGWPSISSS